MADLVVTLKGPSDGETAYLLVLWIVLMQKRMK